MRSRRSEAGPGLEVIEATSHHPRNRQAVARVLERVRTRIRARHLSPRTEKTYLGWIERYIAFHGRRDPGRMGRAEIETFLGHLGAELGLGAASLNQAAAAVLFLYRELYREEYGGRDGVVRAKPVQSLPRYATPEEVGAVMTHLPKVPRMAAMFMYGSGSRLAETMAIRVKDLNLVNRELTVRAGKGAKDRVVPIARRAVEDIGRQIEAVARLHTRDLEAGTGWAQLPGALARKDPGAGWEVAWQYLFPSQKLTRDPKTGRRGRLAVHHTTIQRAIKAAVREAGISKPLSAHVLRACFATEMIRSGCEISTLQRLMGHRDLKTTARYLHVVQRPGLNIESVSVSAWVIREGDDRALLLVGGPPRCSDRSSRGLSTAASFAAATQRFVLGSIAASGRSEQAPNALPRSADCAAIYRVSTERSRWPGPADRPGPLDPSSCVAPHG